MNLGISVATIFRADSAAQSADGIPLDTYGAVAAQAVIGVVAALGLARLLLRVIFIIAVDWLARKGIGMIKPVVHAATAPGHYAPWILFALSVIGLIFSLIGKSYSRGENFGAA